MASNRHVDTASAVTLTLTTEVAVVTSAPQAPYNVASAPVLVRARVMITGAASATTCTLKLRRGSGVTGTDILASDPVVSVPGSAIDAAAYCEAIETAANFNTAAGIYTLTGNAAGAAQAARIASIEIQPLAPGV